MEVKGWHGKTASRSERGKKMEVMEWIVDVALGWLFAGCLVLAGVSMGAGIVEHDCVLAAFGVGFAGVAWLLWWLDDMEV